VAKSEPSKQIGPNFVSEVKSMEPPCMPVGSAPVACGTPPEPGMTQFLW